MHILTVPVLRAIFFFFFQTASLGSLFVFASYGLFSFSLSFWLEYVYIVPMLFLSTLPMFNLKGSTQIFIYSWSPSQNQLNFHLSDTVWCRNVAQWRPEWALHFLNFLKISFNVLFKGPFCPEQGTSHPVFLSTFLPTQHTCSGIVLPLTLQSPTGGLSSFLSIRSFFPTPEDLNRTLPNVANLTFFRTVWKYEWD